MILWLCWRQQKICRHQHKIVLTSTKMPIYYNQWTCEFVDVDRRFVNINKNTQLLQSVTLWICWRRRKIRRHQHKIALTSTKTPNYYSQWPCEFVVIDRRFVDINIKLYWSKKNCPVITISDPVNLLTWTEDLSMST